MLSPSTLNRALLRMPELAKALSELSYYKPENNKVSLPYKVSQVQRWLPPTGLTLDFGCGDGAVGYGLRSLGRIIKLYDPYTTCGLPFDFDTTQSAYALCSIHHCENALETFKRLRRGVKGRLLVREIACETREEKQIQVLLDILSQCPGYPTFYSKQEWLDLAKEAGWRVTRVWDEKSTPNYNFFWMVLD